MKKLRNRAEPPPGRAETYQVPAVVRALNIIEYVGRNQEASFTEIFSDLGLPKSSTYQILNTLAQRGYLRHRGDSAKFSLGFRLFEAGNQAVARLDARTEAMPILRGLVERTGETCHLGILEGREGVYLAKVEGTKTFRLHSWEGKRLPLHSTAMGKVFLAWLDPAELEEFLDELNLERFTENTITDPTRLREHLALIREQGWALDDQENEAHIRCISAPVRGLEGRVNAALSISGLATQFSGDYLRELSSLVRAACQELSGKLGAG